MRKKIKKHKFLEKKNNIALEVKNIKFKYKPNHPFALNDVSFKIEHGQYIAIIGHNGSGKSTLSKIILGVLNNQEGSIKIFGHDVSSKNIHHLRHFLGIVFQNPDNQFIGSTVEDDIAFGLENRLIPQEKMWPIVKKAAEKVGMLDYLGYEPLMLSGGQKQKVAIASTLALSPDIIILDEATSMLDPKGRKDIKDIVLEIKNQRKKTIISITHDMDEALNADQVIVMNKGQMLKMGKPTEILSNYEFLKSIHLDMPFNYRIAYELNKKGIKIPNGLTEDELVEAIWKAK